MRHERGDIWDCLRRGYYVIIPVNIGWKIDQVNVMGRGLAKDAKARFPACDIWLGGEQFKLYHEVPEIEMTDPRWIMPYPYGPLIFFPTKGLDRARPYLSWAGKSDLGMIDKLVQALPILMDGWKYDRVAIPLLGSGNGGLDPFQVRDLLKTRLKEDKRFVLVTPPWI